MADIYIINGSPRIKGNTIQLCEQFKNGVETKGLTAEIINLYKLKFTGCRACFACKRLNSPTFKKCVFPDDLKNVLEDISNAEGLVLATPIYFGNVTGEMQSFIERLFFPFFTYNKDYKAFPPKMLETAVIYTMNVGKDWFDSEYTKPQTALMNFENWFSLSYQKPERICAYNTLQFDDYSKYASEIFSEDEKRQYHKDNFAKDLQTAFDAGVKMAEKIINKKAGTPEE